MSPLDQLLQPSFQAPPTRGELVRQVLRAAAAAAKRTGRALFLLDPTRQLRLLQFLLSRCCRRWRRAIELAPALRAVAPFIERRGPAPGADERPQAGADDELADARRRKLRCASRPPPECCWCGRSCTNRRSRFRSCEPPVVSSARRAGPCRRRVHARREMAPGRRTTHGGVFAAAELPS